MLRSCSLFSPLFSRPDSQSVDYLTKRLIDQQQNNNQMQIRTLAIRLTAFAVDIALASAAYVFFGPWIALATFVGIAILAQSIKLFIDKLNPPEPVLNMENCADINYSGINNRSADGESTSSATLLDQGSSSKANLTFRGIGHDIA